MHFVIVGGGAAGTLLALMILRHAPASVRVTVLDREGAFGRGVAYAAGGAHHRINVPALKMGGLEPEDAEGFVRWLAAQGRSLPDFEASFVPRAWFGDYLVAALDAALVAARSSAQAGSTRLQLRRAEVTALAPRPGGGWCCTGPGLALDADALVLCPGNPPPARPPALPEVPRWVGDVWAPGALDGIAADDTVAVIGTGATAVDAVLELRQRGHHGRCVMLSRRGLLPLVDRPAAPYADFFDPGGAPALRSVMHRLRAEVREAAARGVPWQAVVDAFRVHAGALWMQWSPRDRARFLRHVRPWWMVHRHRLAPDVAARLRAEQAAGTLQVRAGRVRAVHAAAPGCTLDVAPAPAGRAVAPPQTLHADWVLNCVGPSEDFTRLDHPLWQGLLRQGLVRGDPLGLGLDVDEQLRLLDRDGRAHADLYALGLPTRGRFWEVTAVIHVRQQAAALVQRLWPADAPPARAPFLEPFPLSTHGVPT